MSDLYSLEAFRGIVKGTPENQTPVFHLVPVDGGYLLENPTGARLKTFRGSLRVFSSADTAIRFITENISRPMMRAVEIRLITAPGLFQ